MPKLIKVSTENWYVQSPKNALFQMGHTTVLSHLKICGGNATTKFWRLKIDNAYITQSQKPLLNLF